MRRIVVTGMGAVSPLAANVPVTWSRLLAGRSGVKRLSDDIVGDLPSKIGGVVPTISEDAETGFDADSILAPKDQRKVDRFILFALAAAEEALKQAGWKPVSETEKERTATIIASGIGGFPAITAAVRTVDQKGARRLSPFTVPSFLVNLAAGQVSIRHGFKGPIGAPVTACAAGVQAIGDAARLIRSNEADIAICGGAEACINEVSLGGFVAARSLSTGFNDTPEKASRPFDTQRDGFVMGEGAGILVIEALSHALARGATPLAELVGYGTSADAHHITSGPEDGGGARRAIEIAISQAGIRPDDIGHINAHATSTQIGDLGEIGAIKSVFGATTNVAVSATKSATGHLLGAAGGLEAIFTILALRDQVAPPTLNLDTPDIAGEGLGFVAKKAQSKAMEYALSNGFGFGGVNASVLFRRGTAKFETETKIRTDGLTAVSRETLRTAPMKRSKPDVAIVTGASSGIGLATANALLNAGYRVFGTSRRANYENVDGITMVPCDVTDETSVAKLVETVLKEAGSIDVLVNNAGIGLLAGAEESSIAQAQALFDVNVFGVIRVTNAVLPVMRRQKSGRIINLSSVLGLIPAPYNALYASTKHAIEGYSESLDHEVRTFGIRVVLIEPAYTRSAFEENVLKPDQPIGLYEPMRFTMSEHLRDQIAVGDTPETVATTVLAAVTETSPKRRYTAGKLAGKIRFLRRLAPESSIR